MQARCLDGKMKFSGKPQINWVNGSAFFYKLFPMAMDASECAVQHYSKLFHSSLFFEH